MEETGDIGEGMARILAEDIGGVGGAQMGGYRKDQSQGVKQDGSHRNERSLQKGLPGLDRADRAAGQHGGEGRAQARANQFRN